uniref:Putative histone h1-ii-1 pediculus us corporis histone h1-ii-1 n=1 Tax=Ixodes ricinus TaxID=34613 RepID=V5HSL5_IXORI
MSEEVSAPAGAAAPAALKSPKKASAKVSKGKAKAVPTHPKVSAMVTASISALKERGGSSLQAIKKYMSANYKVDVEKLSPFIRKYLKSAVAAGALVQTKGKGGLPDRSSCQPSPTSHHLLPESPRRKPVLQRSAQHRQLPVRPGRRSPGVPRSPPQRGPSRPSPSRPSQKSQRQRRRPQHLRAPRNPRQQRRPLPRSLLQRRLLPRNRSSLGYPPLKTKTKNGPPQGHN